MIGWFAMDFTLNFVIIVSKLYDEIHEPITKWNLSSDFQIRTNFEAYNTGNDEVKSTMLIPVWCRHFASGS